MDSTITPTKKFQRNLYTRALRSKMNLCVMFNILLDWVLKKMDHFCRSFITLRSVEVQGHNVEPTAKCANIEISIFIIDVDVLGARISGPSHKIGFGVI